MTRNAIAQFFQPSSFFNLLKFGIRTRLLTTMQVNLTLYTVSRPT